MECRPAPGDNRTGRIEFCPKGFEVGRGQRPGQDGLLEFRVKERKALEPRQTGEGVVSQSCEMVHEPGRFGEKARFPAAGQKAVEDKGQVAETIIHVSYSNTAAGSADL